MPANFWRKNAETLRIERCHPECQRWLILLLQTFQRQTLWSEEVETKRSGLRTFSAVRGAAWASDMWHWEWRWIWSLSGHWSCFCRRGWDSEIWENPTWLPIFPPSECCTPIVDTVSCPSSPPLATVTRQLPCCCPIFSAQTANELIPLWWAGTSRQGTGDVAAQLELSVDEDKESVKFHTAIFPSVAALNSSLYLQERHSYRYKTKC